jgi:3D (Asp-Asp-Asp) domain-containing protein
LKEPEHYCSNLTRLIERLRIKSLPRPIRPLFPKAGSVAALLSIGLSSFPGIPAAGGVPADKHREHHCEAVAIPERAITAKPAVAIPVPNWIPVKATSYSWREPDHVPFGKHNCMGGDLTHLVEGLEQCAADLSCYPLGSILCIKTDDGEEFRIVTDCGKSVRGAHHIDLHFDSLADMEARGTRKALVIVIRHGWKP